MVGEVFERDAAQTAFFIGGHEGWDGIDTKLDSVFDFASWNTSLQVFTNKAPLRALRDQLKYDALYPDPMKITNLTNNHDTPRFMSLEGATLEGAIMHVAYILSIRGIPQLYYGEEIAMEGKEDPDNRRDFPGGFPGDTRNVFTDAGRKEKERQMYEWTQAWIKLRAEHSAVRDGRLIDLHYDNETYVFARQIHNQTVIVAFNRDGAEKKVTLPVSAIGLRDGSDVVSLIGSPAGDRVVKGKLLLSIPAKRAVAYIAR
jgi:glycosidase